MHAAKLCIMYAAHLRAALLHLACMCDPDRRLADVHVADVKSC